MGMLTHRTTGEFLVLIFVVQSLSNCTALPVARNQSVQTHRFRPGRNRITIIGGTDAREDEYRWQVSLQRPQYGISEPLCGGVIINTRTILTAGHCFTDQENGEPILPTSVIVVAGIVNIGDPEGVGQTIKVIDAKIHPAFKMSTLENDIAVVTLESPLTFNSKVKSIPIAKSGSVPTGKCTVVGWGDTKESYSPLTLQKVDLRPVKRGNCQKLWKKEDSNAKVTDGMVCAHHYRKGTCHGDSGSGFICKSGGKDYLAGLVSWGEGFPECGYNGRLPSVFTNIAHYVNFIGPV